MMTIAGLPALQERLRRLDLASVQRLAMARAGEQVADAIRQKLSNDTGDAHAVPWMRSGALRDSIGYEVDGTDLMVGSTTSVAVDQELGTHSIPPRPFLGPAAAAAAEWVATTVGAAIADTLTGT